MRFAALVWLIALAAVGCAAEGPREYSLSTPNRGQAPMTLTRQPTARFTVSGRGGHVLEQYWIDKGAGRPTDIGVHVSRMTPGYSRSVPSTPYGGQIPYTVVYDPIAHRGWYFGIESSGRVSIEIFPHAHAAEVFDVELGLAPEEGYQTIVAPGATFEWPTVFAGEFAGDLDDAANILHKWIGSHLRPPTSDHSYPLLTNNSWGNGMVIDEKLARRMIDDSAELGIEMFGFDAGWFRWVGDWRPNPAKFPDGLGPVIAYAHSKGLKVGMWVGWTQGGDHVDETGRHQILSVNDPDMKDWFARDYKPDWKSSDFTGADVCLADVRAQHWCLETLRRIVRENKLDMLEHDQRMIVDHCIRTDHGHTASRSDVAHHAAQGYYQIYDTLRRENPNLLFENCVNGGNMVDFGVARRCHYISITDSYDPLSNRRAFYDATYCLPPAMCECYVENRQGRSPANFKYMLRSGMMGWCTIMLDMGQWTGEQRTAARREFQIYKQRIRPLINHANLYHISGRPDGIRFDGMQYYDPTGGRGVLFAFRGTTSESAHTFKLKGLDPAARYQLTFEDGNLAPIERRGAQLMSDGLEIALPEPESSQLVYIKGPG